MLIQKGQNLKIFTLAFSVFVFLGILTPPALAGGGGAATVAAPIVFTNEMVIGGKRMIVETRIYEAPVAAKVATAINVPAAGKVFIKPTRGNLIQGYRQGHYAFDIADDSLPFVWATAAGTVIRVVNDCDRISYGCGGGYGNHVIVDHGDGLSSLYGHLEYTSVNVGDLVKAGQTLGRMGQSGNVLAKTGPHLHFEIRLNGLKKSPGEYF